MGGVADDQSPGHVEEGGGPACGRHIEGRQRLSQLFEGSLGSSRGLLHVDPVGGHSHEHVGAESGAELAAPLDESVIGGRRQVVRQ